MTLLTREQAEFIYKVGKGLPFNFGFVVVTKILRETSKSKSSNLLLYPSLIYRLLTNQGYQTPKGAKLEKETTLISFEKALIYSDKRVRDFPYKMPPLSRAASEEVEDVDGDDCNDADPTSAPNISVREACFALPLLVQKVEFGVHALEDLKDVVEFLKKLQAPLNPTNMQGGRVLLVKKLCSNVYLF